MAQCTALRISERPVSRHTLRQIRKGWVEQTEKKEPQRVSVKVSDKKREQKRKNS